jgi:hypothetical protein
VFLVITQMIQTCNLWTWFKFAASKSSNMYHFPLFHYLKLLVSETHIRLKKWILEKTFAVSQPLHSPPPSKKKKNDSLYIYKESFFLLAPGIQSICSNYFTVITFTNLGTKKRVQNLPKGTLFPYDIEGNLNHPCFTGQTQFNTPKTTDNLNKQMGQFAFITMQFKTIMKCK